MMKQPVRTNISDFIKTTLGSQFVIPVYQRKYTWNPHTETGRFMNDIEDLLEGKSNHHFIGILIYLESDISWMYKEIQIVDGQQRLTTTFIFLLALKQLALEEGANEVAGMIDDYYLFNTHANANARVRLKPSVSQDDVYAKLVYGNDLDLTRSDKESTVYRNYEYIRRRLQEFHKKHSFLAILDTLTKLDILAFPLSKQDNAQAIFESINSTGAPLTSADLIRNYIFMNDTNDVQERYYRMYWQPLEKRFPDSRRLEEFFRFYLSIKTGNLAARRDIYDIFKKWWNHSDENREVRLREINRYCRYFFELYQGPSEDAQLEEVLKDVRLNESRLPAPFSMEMYRLYDEGKIDRDTFVKQLRLIDSYLTRRALCGMQSQELNRYFPQLLRSVMNAWEKNNRNIHEITKVFLINYNRGKGLAMPTDEQLRASLKEVNAYSLLCIRPVLERIEHHKATALVDTSSLNIEHIMPQHPNRWWQEHSNAKNMEEYSFYANLIGNLTLCAEYDNVKMGNEDFAFKKEVLSKTLHIRMNTELLEKNTWNIKDIEKRCDVLTDQIIEIYPYMGGDESEFLSSNDDVIVMNTPSVNARAIYHSDSSIEILSGTTMKAYGPMEMKSMRETYRDMVDNRVIYEDENGQMIFDKNYRFHDLNTAAQFLLHRGGDNTNAWLCESGVVFTETLEKRKEKKINNLDTKKEAKKEVKKEVKKESKKEVKKEIVKVQPQKVKQEEKQKVEAKPKKKQKAKRKSQNNKKVELKSQIASKQEKKQVKPKAKLANQNNSSPTVKQEKKQNPKQKEKKLNQPTSKNNKPKQSSKKNKKVNNNKKKDRNNKNEKRGYPQKPKTMNIRPQKEPATQSVNTSNNFLRHLAFQNGTKK